MVIRYICNLQSDHPISLVPADTIHSYLLLLLLILKIIFQVKVTIIIFILLISRLKSKMFTQPMQIHVLIASR